MVKALAILMACIAFLFSVICIMGPVAIPVGHKHYKAALASQLVIVDDPAKAIAVEYDDNSLMILLISCIGLGSLSLRLYTFIQLSEGIDTGIRIKGPTLRSGPYRITLNNIGMFNDMVMPMFNSFKSRRMS